MFSKLVYSLSAMIALILTSTISHADQVDKINSRNGLTLAQKLCSNCHVVAPENNSVANETAPSFKEIASYKGQTEERIAGKIVVPHPDMPTVSLTRAEIRDIVSYIITLKKE